MAIAGKDGNVTLGSSEVASIKTWKVDPEFDMLETTALGDDWKSFISGLAGWSASAEGDYVINSDTSGQTSLQTSFLAGTSVSLKLYVNATNYYSGTAFISKMPVETPVGETVTVSLEFQGTGALSYN